MFPECLVEHVHKVLSTHLAMHTRKAQMKRSREKKTGAAQENKEDMHAFIPMARMCGAHDKRGMLCAILVGSVAHNELRVAKNDLNFKM